MKLKTALIAAGLQALLLLTALPASATSSDTAEGAPDKYVITSKTNHPAAPQRPLKGGMRPRDNWGMKFPVAPAESEDKKSSGSDVCSLTGLKDIYWGWNFNYDSKNGIKNCFEVGVAHVVGFDIAPFAKGPSFSVGLGFGMRRYLVQEGLRFDNVDNDLVIKSAALHQNMDKNRVDSWTFHVPVMVTQKLYRGIAVSVGAWINFNTYVKGESQYYIDNIRYKEHYKGFNQRFCTVDLVGALGVKNGIAVYGRWSPMTLFSEGRGPEFRSASLGVMLNF